MVIMTQYYADDKSCESNYPQVGSRSGSSSFQNVYWKTLLVMFSSCRRTSPGAKLVLVTNVTIFPTIARVSVEDELMRLGVIVLEEEFSYAPPQRFGGSWRATFFKFDALRAVLRTVADDELIVQVDADCIWTTNQATLEQRIELCDIVAYNVGTSEKEQINGLTRAEMTEVARRYGYCVGSPMIHYGGEFAAARANVIARILAEVDRIWPMVKEDFAVGVTTFKTEEHILSCVYSSGKVRVDSGLGIVRRIWTQPAFRNVERTDVALCVWHLPAEKHYGFRELFPTVCDTESWFWADDYDIARIAGIMGLTQRGIWRALRQRLRRIGLKALSLSGRL